MQDDDGRENDQERLEGQGEGSSVPDDATGYDDDEWAGTDEQLEWAEESPPAPARPAALAATFALGVVVSLLLVLAWAAFTGDDDEGATTTASSVTRDDEPQGTAPLGSELPDTDDSSQGHELGTRLSRCVRAARALGEPLRAAQPALDQWAVHVGAMNKLVVGEITLQQATAFWERTRVGAQRKVAEFRDAMGTMRRQGVDCPRADLLAPGARALPGCARQVEAQTRVLSAATTSIDTWDEHVRHMDMLRLGQLSPEDATRMWLSMWKRGVRDLDTYHAAVQESRRLDGCARVGAAAE